MLVLSSFFAPLLTLFTEQCSQSETVCAFASKRALASRVCDAHETCARSAEEAQCRPEDSKCPWSVPRDRIVSHELFRRLPETPTTSSVIQTLNTIVHGLSGPLTDGMCDDGEYAHMSLVYRDRAQTYDRLS